MLKLSDLRPAKGSKKAKRRLGRGVSSGQGRQCGKGHKGQNARAGGGVRPGFEGGQTPIYRRSPKKRGFNNIFKKQFAVINLDDLNNFDEGTTVTLELLKEKRLVRGYYDYLKILGNGELTKKLTVKADQVSKSAEDKLLKTGSKIEKIVHINKLLRVKKAKVKKSK